jgi:hypothetical protein
MADVRSVAGPAERDPIVADIGVIVLKRGERRGRFPAAAAAGQQHAALRAADEPGVDRMETTVARPERQQHLQRFGALMQRQIVAIREPPADAAALAVEPDDAAADRVADEARVGRHRQQAVPEIPVPAAGMGVIRGRPGDAALGRVPQVDREMRRCAGFIRAQMRERRVHRLRQRASRNAQPNMVAAEGKV